MSKTVKPSEFRLTFADPDFQWAGERRAGLPILRWSDGTICEPVLAYFGYSAESKRVQVSSMRSEAHAIREWLAFLASKGRRWEDADDLLLGEWRESQCAAKERFGIKARQIERKLDCVFNFYRLLPDALPFDERGRLRELFVGQPVPREGIRFPITSKEPRSTKNRRSEVWNGSERVGRSSSKRPTPEDHQVKKILTWLRSKPERQTTRRSGDQAQQRLALDGERDWLIARCMVDGGLRAAEVCDLPLRALAKALQRESILLPREGAKADAAGLHMLDCLGDNPEERNKILGRLDALEDRHRRSLFVEVTGKGQKTRMAPFTVDLVRDLLEIGVWTLRRQLIARWTRSDLGSLPQLVFLSSKTKGRFEPGTVGDLMKEAFRAVGVEGSGHRLRAYYAMTTAVRLWEEHFRMNGYRFDQTVVNTVLERLAEAMGHSQVSTTVRHYLDLAILKYFGVGSRTKLVAMRNVWDALTRRQSSLSHAKVQLVVRAIAGLAAMPDGSELETVIGMALADPDLNPDASRSETVEDRRTGKPDLKLIVAEE